MTSFNGSKLRFLLIRMIVQVRTFDEFDECDGETS